MRIIKKLTALDKTAVTVKYDTEWEEYQVHIAGAPDATYHTDDKEDALQTAGKMVADLDQRAAAAAR